MKYLLEHEVAFDDTALGFPSIQGCHAIVFQTAAGLYGFHVAGNSGDERWGPSGTLFSRFVNGVSGGSGTGTRLYGSSFIGNNQRGYKVGQFVEKEYRAKWKAELVAYATALRYTGKISGYDLYKSFTASSASAYVEYRVNGDKCDVSVRQWTHGEHAPKVANRAPLHHMIKGGGSLENQGLIRLTSSVSAVSRTGLTAISKEKLR